MQQLNREKTFVSEPRLLSWLHLCSPVTLTLDHASLSIGNTTFPVVEISGISVSHPWLFPKLLGGRVFRVMRINGKKSVTHSFNIFKKDAHTLSKQITQRVIQQLTLTLNRIEASADSLLARQQSIYRHDVYVRSSVALRFSDAELNGYTSNISYVQRISKHRLLDVASQNKAALILKTLQSIEDHIRTPELARNRHNDSYALYWRDKEKDYFKTVESDDLTEEQIQTALVFEDATLVVAAAGSGKSSCIVGKIGFALKTGLFDDSQILALAYNKKAALGLQTRLNKKLGKALNRPVSVASKTFHSFGLATLVAHHGKEYEPKVLKEDEGEEGRFLKQVIFELAKNNAAFQNALALWMSFVPYDEPQPVGISGNLEECAKRYEECCRERLRIRIATGKKPWDPTIPTWHPDVYVRSLEERGIANWLLLHGVSFEYERPDWDGAKRLGLGTYQNGKSKPYNPDFTYSYVEKLPHGQTRTVRVIHEHFALDEKGRAPEWLGGTTYEQYAKNKREMYRAWMGERPIGRERVVFIETTSAMMRDGSIWNHLKRSLKDAGIVVHAPKVEIQNRALEQFREASDLEQLIIDFVLRYKDSGLDEHSIRAEANQSHNPYRSQLFLDVAFAVFGAYQQALRDAGKIDFADMLRESIAILSDSRTESPYRFILVDEFQDISRLKADLVKAVLAKNPLESILFCVGDDWQTINRFSGSDVSIFTDVSQYFERPTARLELTKTFRCSQGIADVAKHLVMLNSGQFNKEVKALPDRVPGAVRIVHHGDSAEERQATVRAELDNIIITAQSLKLVHPTVQILRRTKHDATVPEGLNTDFLKGLSREYKGRLEIELHTMHGSKGLEADFVIIPGLDSGFRGIPDERPTEPILDLVLPALRSPVDEERRLMYVALTRAKNMVSVLVSGRRPSEFIVELEPVRQRFPAINWIPWTGETRAMCPQCKIGSLVPKRGASGALLCTRAVKCGFSPKGEKRKP
jgi:DNA helicase IV